MSYERPQLFVFTSARFPEAALLLEREDGSLVTCDAVQNWTHVDRFFFAETGALFAAQGLIGEANLPATGVKRARPKLPIFDASRPCPSGTSSPLMAPPS